MFNLDIVYEWIASIPMAGLDVRGLGNVQLDSTLRGLPIFQPDIREQVLTTALTRDSYGTGTVAKMTLTYNIPYVLLYKPVGAERSINTNLREVVAHLKTIFTAIIQNDNPSAVDDVTVDLLPVSMKFGRPVYDANGGAWYGGTVIIGATEFIN